MKIAVITIAKNEEGFVPRWYNSCKDADYHLILDTGSTDNTVEMAKELGINVEVKTFSPWRFDTARNYALSLVPKDIDYVINLDMDEVLVEEWKKHFENMPLDVTRPRYKYVWSWTDEGKEGLVYGGDKIHSRHGYKWRHAVHEVIAPLIPEKQYWIGLEIHHHPDKTKPRSQYLSLLQLAVEEDLDDARNAFYYARELYFYQRYPEAIQEFTRFLALPTATWKPERARAMRYLYNITGEVKHLWDAVTECPNRREGWVELAQHAYKDKDWPLVFFACQRALSITEKPLEYLNEEFAWGSKPHDLLAIASYYLGIFSFAKKHGKIAMELSPNDIRLQKNWEYYVGNK